jgi:hypothetical protein
MSVKASWAVSEELRPSFSSLRPTSRPGVSRATTKALMPSVFALPSRGGSVRAMTT